MLKHYKLSIALLFAGIFHLIAVVLIGVSIHLFIQGMDNPELDLVTLIIKYSQLELAGNLYYPVAILAACALLLLSLGGFISLTRRTCLPMTPTNATESSDSAEQKILFCLQPAKNMQ